MLDHRIDANTSRYAVLGKTLGHTWSPVIHNSLFSAAGRNAVYLPVTVPEESLKAVCDVFRSSFSGFNVTIPYKERIIPLLDDVDDAVRACGAVNTVEVSNGKLIGHITDGLGMMRAIEEKGVLTDGVDALILGGGGAARVAAYEILKRGGSAVIAVRNLKKGIALAEAIAAAPQDGANRIRVCRLEDIDGVYNLMINCTPVGMYPDCGEAPVSEAVISRCQSVFDAVYNPRETKLLRLASAQGKKCIEGLGMLYYQAVEAQKFWFSGDVGVEQSVLTEIYRQLVEFM